MKILNEKLEETFFKAESNGEFDINITTLLSGDLGVEFMINKKAKVKFNKVALYNIIENLNKIYKTIKQWNRGDRMKILNEERLYYKVIGQRGNVGTVIKIYSDPRSANELMKLLTKLEPKNVDSVRNIYRVEKSDSEL